MLSECVDNIKKLNCIFAKFYYVAGKKNILWLYTFSLNS